MVDTEDIEQAAANARLDLSDEEKQELADDLADILEAFESPDEAGDCLTQEEALSNTENTEDGYVKGPRAT